MSTKIEKAVCQFVSSKGIKKGSICGNSCIPKEAPEPRCAKHKEVYLERQCENMKKRYKEENRYVTKDQRISELSEKCNLLENQVNELMEDPEKTIIEESKKEIESISDELQKQVEKNELIEKENECLRIANQKLAKKIKTILDLLSESGCTIDLLETALDKITGNLSI